jgi:hypothetical protein
MGKTSLEIDVYIWSSQSKTATKRKYNNGTCYNSNPSQIALEFLNMAPLFDLCALSSLCLLENACALDDFLA